MYYNILHKQITYIEYIVCLAMCFDHSKSLLRVTPKYLASIQYQLAVTIE